MPFSFLADDPLPFSLPLLKKAEQFPPIKTDTGCDVKTFPDYFRFPLLKTARNNMVQQYERDADAP